MEKNSVQGNAPGGPASGSWVESSDAYAWPVLKMLARFEPEELSRLGYAEVDEEILRLPADHGERRIAAFEEAIRTLHGPRTQASDPRLALDLELMIGWLELEAELQRCTDALLVPCFNLAAQVYAGVARLLDPQIERHRHPAALVRLLRYAGREEGYPPLAEQAVALLLARLPKRGLVYPSRASVESILAQSGHLLKAIPRLFDEFRIRGYKNAYEALLEQHGGYEDFLRRRLLPRCRDEFRLPSELYAIRLRHSGVDMSIEELASRSRVAFWEIPTEIENLAERVAAKRRLGSADVASVFREVDKERPDDGEILPLFEKRVEQLKAAIERAGFVTLPKTRLRIRFATRAETAELPLVHVRYPRVIGNTGESCELLLPAKVPGASGDRASSSNAFLSPAGSWGLAAHEGLPGHALQLGLMLEQGVSLARRVFGWNMATTEGWAVYAETELMPWLPDEGRLVCLHRRLLRAARSFLDPGLHQGRYTPEQVSWILRHKVGVPAEMAESEIARCTVHMPGQAAAYFCGYCGYADLRAEVELGLGPDFDRRRYHDFLLAQGFLPVRLLRKQVLETFVPREKTAPGP